MSDWSDWVEQMQSDVALLKPEERKDMLKTLRRTVLELERTCPCEVIESGYKSAKCRICDEQYGWWCPDSPDHVCHYYSDSQEGSGKCFVRMIGGNWVELPEDHQPQFETDDTCLFCGHPEERK